MNSESGLYRAFAKAFARKVAYVLCWTLIVWLGLVLIAGVVYVATEIASFILSVTGIATMHPVHLVVTMGVVGIFAGILKIAESAWQEAKTENKEESD